MTPGLLTAHHWVQWTIELLWPRRTVEMAFTTPATRTVRAPVKHLALWDCHTSDAFVIVSIAGRRQTLGNADAKAKAASVGALGVWV